MIRKIVAHIFALISTITITLYQPIQFLIEFSVQTPEEAKKIFHQSKEHFPSVFPALFLIPAVIWSIIKNASHCIFLIFVGLLVNIACASENYQHFLQNATTYLQSSTRSMTVQRDGNSPKTLVSKEHATGLDTKAPVKVQAAPGTEISAEVQAVPDTDPYVAK